jgi:hypothetical protein
MTALTNLSPAASYGDLITCTNNGQGLTASLQPIQDGLGTNSAISLSTTTLSVTGTGGLVVGSGGLVVNGATISPASSVTIAIAATDITGIYGTPKVILAAPGANFAYQIFGFAINYTFGTAAYTGGGNVTLQYGATVHAGAGVITNTIASTIFTSATNTYGYATGSGVVVTGTEAYVNTAVYVSNASGAFVNPGTATGTANLTVYYQIVTAV